VFHVNNGYNNVSLPRYNANDDGDDDDDDDDGGGGGYDDDDCVESAKHIFKHFSPPLSRIIPVLLSYAAMFANGFVDDTIRNTVPNVNKPQLQLVNAVICFL